MIDFELNIYDKFSRVSKHKMELFIIEHYKPSYYLTEEILNSSTPNKRILQKLAGYTYLFKTHIKW